jgi:hypothetical protein
LWGSPDPASILGALEQIGLDAECYTVPCPRHHEHEGPDQSSVEIRLLGQYYGAKMVIAREGTQIVSDGVVGLSPANALVARRTLRQVLLSQLLASEPMT